MKLSDLLKKENNNIDLFRIIAASMVIYAHAYVLSPEAGRYDIIASFFQNKTNAGSLAVKIFFFISGLVVTNSLLSNGDLLKFAIARFFRIWPALILTTVVTVFILGPMLTSLTWREYFSNGETFRYITNIVTMNIQFTLPGVFMNNPYPSSVNGSLWTIPYEVFAYVLLFACYAVGVIKNRWLSVIIFLFILVDPLLSERILFAWLPKDHTVDFLAPSFAFGAILALNKEVVTIKPSTCLGLFIFYFAFKDSGFSMYFAYAAVFMFVLYLSSLRPILKVKPSIDLSYGVYLWGFPVQQVLAQYFSTYGVLFNQTIAMFISLVLGYLSWHICEKHFIEYGRRVSIFLNEKRRSVFFDKSSSDIC
ncbi:acyltransferase family protein [Aeromonas diversa]|uniref:acyltransferase family protein n=1 Tax=Aeromonas diversa TaxID=502790 RepID=UPI003461E756